MTGSYRTNTVVRPGVLGFGGGGPGITASAPKIPLRNPRRLSIDYQSSSFLPFPLSGALSFTAPEREDLLPPLSDLGFPFDAGRLPRSESSSPPSSSRPESRSSSSRPSRSSSRSPESRSSSRERPPRSLRPSLSSLSFRSRSTRPRSLLE